MNIVYLQCDVRYNKWLLSEIDGKSVVEHTIEKCRKLQCPKIVAGIYNCAENRKLVEILDKTDVELVLSNEENVNKRFLDVVIKSDANYCIRVGGDQPLIDVKEVNRIIEEMQRLGLDWFFEEYITCILPDIIKVECLNKYYEHLREEDRYFIGLEKQRDIKKYCFERPILLMYNFRVNSNEGFRICSNIIKNKLDVYDISLKMMLHLSRSKYLNETGMWGSWLLTGGNSDFFYDEDRQVNPWWGRTIIDFLKPHLSRQLSVFEWGAGNSTLFWGQMVKEVISIEYDKKWYDKMAEVIPSNVRLKYYPLEYGGAYCRAILEERKSFDIILIDGRDRVRCAENAVLRLNRGGVIIWDNTERDYYQKGYDFLKKQGFKRIELSSIVYGIPGGEDYTSIFYRKDNFFGI